jgi:RNA polymerase sigma factor (sigma-70 family)|tara:strand:- start:307 stop:759 length:453 start_codon:yes stop_codon:yes gene_type:complete
MDELIEEHMGLVVSIVNSFKPKNHTERDDLIDAGRIGLWKALKKYDIKKDCKLSTFAWRPIRWSIIKEIKNRRESTSINNIPVPSTQKKERIWEAIPSNLTEDEKLLIELRCEGYKLREICDILDEKPSIVKNRFYKLINILKENYTDNE